MGPPIGVEPRKATAVNASNRPRMSSGDSYWAMALAPEMNPAPPTPSGTAHARATRRFGAA